jgi:hypothetical protein
MQKVVGETVKPEEFGVNQIRDIPAGILSWWSRALTLIDGCMENRRFWRRALAPTRVPLNL